MAVEMAWADNVLEENEVKLLNKQYIKLGLTDEEAEIIDMEVMGRTKDIIDKNTTVENLNILVEKGIPEAQYELGNRYQEGIGEFNVDLKKAITMFKQAAEQGYAPAQFSLAIEDNLPKEEKKQWFDMAQTQKYPQKQAENGDKEAQVYYMLACLDGRFNIKKDLNKAKELALHSNHYLRWIILGSIYMENDEIDEAKKMMNKFLDMPDEDNAVIFQVKGEAYSLIGDEKKAYEYFTRSSKKNYSTAEVSLAHCFCEGLGCRENKKKAIEIYEKLEKQGDAESKLQLAILYLQQKDNQKTAIKLLKEIHSKDEIGAFLLGCCFLTGKGVQKDQQNGFQLISDSIFPLLEIDPKRDDISIIISPNELEEIFRYNNDNTYAKYCLGVCFEFGYSVPKNRRHAISWYENAIEDGHKKAKKRRSILLRENPSLAMPKKRPTSKQNYAPQYSDSPEPDMLEKAVTKVGDFFDWLGDL